MFDSVYIECPNCKELVECQSKSGSCMLENYTICDAPFTVMAGILNRDGGIKCYKCKKGFIVKLKNNPEYIVEILSDEKE